MGNRFLEDLTSIPGLELARQDARAELLEDSLSALIGSVPFALGSEFVTKDWLRLLYRGLNEVYTRERKDLDKGRISPRNAGTRKKSVPDFNAF